MADGEIHYARLPITLDSNGVVDFPPVLSINAIFPPTDYDIVDTAIVPISGGSGISNAVLVIIARRLTV